MLHARNELSHTHTSSDKLTKNDVKKEIESIKARLSREFASETDKLNELLKIVDELSEFELGRFLIKNKGAFSGYWSWYFLLGFNNKPITSALESFIVERVPVLLASRERFGIFQDLLLKNIRSHSTVCSIPCGMMTDLLTLNLDGSIQGIRFVGIDLDATVFSLAEELAKEMKCRAASYEFVQKDAWDLGIENAYDIITTNGLNIYEKDDSKVVALYRGLFAALKSNGKLICSALTYPIGHPESEWDLSKIDLLDLETASTLFKTILQATWSNFRTSKQTCSQLQEAGFENFEIYWDSRKLFPTFLAQKPGVSPK